VLQPDQVERALVITAHPDDVDFGAAGTVANLTDAGAVVTYCLVTDGQAGGFDQAIPRERMAMIRRDEQTKAAAEVGVTDLVFLGHMDGSVQFTLDLRRDLSRVIREVRPQVVITQAPTINVTSVYGSHPDHVATGQGAWAAVYPDARNPFAFPDLLVEGYEPWSVDELWIMFGAGSPNEPLETIDITRQIDRKMRALRAHQSQHTDPDAMEERVRAWWGSIASEFGLPEGSYAERFYVADTR
jgi:LmbE family N-acetylglucosaminyl deacetylase